MNKYAVVSCYSFDPECIVVSFNTEEEAVEYLRKSYANEYKIDKEENGWDSVGYIYKNGWCATIINHFSDRDDVTEFRVVVAQAWKI